MLGHLLSSGQLCRAAFAASAPPNRRLVVLFVRHAALEIVLHASLVSRRSDESMQKGIHNSPSIMQSSLVVGQLYSVSKLQILLLIRQLIIK